MKVLLQSRSTLYSVFGGDTVQIEKTADALRSLGCVVDISLESEPDVGSYDLVHLFNFTRPQDIYVQARNAKSQEKKVVLSTIYVDYEEYDLQARSGVPGLAMRMLSASQREYVKSLGRVLLNGEFNPGVSLLLRTGYRRAQTRILELTDVLLPNSHSEMCRLLREFPEAQDKQVVVVPNAVDAELFSNCSSELTVTPSTSTAILCVARIEGRKNQLNLVRAAKDLPWPVVLVGACAPNHQRYLEQIREEGGDQVTFVGPVNHERLPDYYRSARVHALVSWMETTGLSSLEAGVSGCNLVVTDKGDTRDYFDGYAQFCSPDSVESIRGALIKAHESVVSPSAKQHFLKHYTWQAAAEKTLAGYEIALANVSKKGSCRAGRVNGGRD